MEYIENARGKINLTLKVLGRQENGYHTLQSLVAFSNISDRIVFIPSPKNDIEVTGPFGKDLKGQNLLEKVFDILLKQYPQLVLGKVILEKNLPVASGMGGGSADAAALLQAIIRANPEIKYSIDWVEIANQLGSDVTVCFQKQAIWMSGVGNILHPLDKPLPALSVLLVNPMVTVPPDKTAQVFRLLNAQKIKKKDALQASPIPNLINKKDLLDKIKSVGNDLLSPASRLVPQIRRVLDIIQLCEGNEISSLTGAGPTCFGIFENNQKAEAAMLKITASHPHWWVKAGTLS